MFMSDWPNAKVRLPSPGAGSSAPASVENALEEGDTAALMPPALNLGTLRLLRCATPFENTSERAPREAVVSLRADVAARRKTLLNTKALILFLFFYFNNRPDTKEETETDRDSREPDTVA